MRKLLKTCAAAICPLIFALALSALERDVTISVYQGHCIDGDFNANLATARQATGKDLDTATVRIVVHCRHQMDVGLSDGNPSRGLLIEEQK